MNKELFYKTDSLVGKNLFRSRIKLSNLKTLFWHGVHKQEFFLTEFAQPLRCKNKVIPDIYFTFLDADVISPTLIRNQNAKAKE